MKRIGILTLGCRVNQYESDAICEALEKRGYKIADFFGECDLYIINTCTVTAESDAKCRKAIRRAARLRDKYSSRLAVMGCFSQGAPDAEVLSLSDFVIGNRDKMSVVEQIEEIISGKERGGVKSLDGAEFEKMNITHCRHAKAYVKIEDGCNNFCTYCFVPYVRGRVRSRSVEDIMREISDLCEGGYREIILTGIETASFGEDRQEKDALVRLISEIHEKTSIERVRLGSMYPSFFTRDISKRLSEIPIVLPHFHLSVQSAATSVLSAMKRGYTREELYRAVENIREFFPDCALSCDMICGFPGESEEDFLDSMHFIKDAEILHAHIFPYSKREGTRAAKFENQIDEKTKHNRASLMQKHAEEVREGVLERYCGKPVRVLVERERDGICDGYTEHFVHVEFEKIQGVGVGDVAEFFLRKENVNLSQDTESSQK